MEWGRTPNDSPDNQKRENLLNLAMQVTRQERDSSIELGVGASQLSGWELILKYHGDLENEIQKIEQQEGFFCYLELLLPGYAIVTVPEEKISLISELSQVDYVEKPKALYEESITLNQAQIASCIPEITQRKEKLSGQGVLLGIPDSGIQYEASLFRDAQGNSRIAGLWDQSKIPEQPTERAPDGFWHGVEYDAEQLDNNLRKMPGAEQLSFDRSGHGSAVATIAGGSGVGVAGECEFLIVKLGSGQKQGFTRTTELMRAVTWMLRKAQQLGKPIVINISYGSTYGSHEGSSLLEQFLNTATDTYKSVICVGSGNEASAAGHALLQLEKQIQPFSDTLRMDDRRQIVEWNVAEYESGISLSIWKNYGDQLQIRLKDPGGEEFAIGVEKLGKQSFQLGKTKLLFYVGEPTPYSSTQEYYFDFIGEPYLEEGIWQLIITPIRIRDGRISMYLPSSQILHRGTGFVRPTPIGSFTIPSTAKKVITVGAYHSAYQEYADFSGRGFLHMETEQKPDLVAPGVNLLVPDGVGGSQVVSGTSFSAPFVAGCCALLMEWGIVRRNDPFLYGEKLKAYLLSGANQRAGEQERYPNPQMGWGTLCLSDSLPNTLQ